MTVQLTPNERRCLDDLAAAPFREDVAKALRILDEQAETLARVQAALCEEGCGECAFVRRALAGQPEEHIQTRQIRPCQPEAPRPMHLDCPKCGLEHVDTLDPATGIDWSTRPHRTHLCLGCGHLFKPSEHYTVGVARQPEAPKVYGQGYDDDCNEAKPEAPKGTEADILSTATGSIAAHAEYLRAELVAAKAVIADQANDETRSNARIAQLEQRITGHEHNYLAVCGERDSANARADAAERDLERFSHGKLATRCAVAETERDQLAARVKELEADRDRMQGVAISNAKQRDYAHGSLCVIRDALNGPLYTNQVEEGAARARALVRQFFSGIGDSSVCTPEERAVLEAVRLLLPLLPSPDALLANKQLTMPAKGALAELANRAAKAKRGGA